jgi:carbon monoxide dehydrogenase subunit G
MRLNCAIDVSAPPAAVWAVVSDPTRYLDFMSGVTRWEVESDEPGGLGARYRMLLRVGSAEIGGLIEVVEWEEPSDMAWTSVTGVDQRGRWRVRAREHGSRVELRLSYGVAGTGIWGMLAERFAAPTVRGHLRRTLQQLKRQVEYQQLRDAAAARRERAGTT